MRRSLRSALPLLLLVSLALPSCQRRGEPTIIPTQDQWRRIQENVLTEAPEVSNPVGAMFAENFELVGWDLEPEAPEVGDEITFTFWWKTHQAIDERWRIFVHLDGGGQRQNLDHEAVNDLYPTTRWKTGDVIRDQVSATLESNMPPGEIRIYLGFWRDDDRLPVPNPGAGEVQEDGRLLVGTFDASWDPPTLDIRRASSAIDIDGRGTDRAWARAQRTPIWVNPVSGERVEGGDAWAKMLWDDENLYVLMHARDPDIWSTITERDGDLWDEEVLEFYADPTREGRNYLEFQINPLGAVFDAVFQRPTNRDLPRARAQNIEGMQTAVHVSGTTDKRDDTDRSWSAELLIPLAHLPSLELPVENGDAMGVNFYRYNRPADREHPITSAWSVVGAGSFHNPPRFGVATFRGAPERPASEGGGAGAEGSGETMIRMERPLRRLPATRRAPPGATATPPPSTPSNE